MIMIIVVKIPT